MFKIFLKKRQRRARAPPTPFAEILPKTLRAFQRKMPNVHVRLRDWSNKDTLDGVGDSRLELGLILFLPRAVRAGTCNMKSCFTIGFAWRSLRSIPLPDGAAFRSLRSRPNPFISLTREDYRNYYDLLSATFSKLKQKPRIIEKHDSFAGVISAVEAGTGVAIAADFGFSVGNRIKFLRLTLEPKPISVGMIMLEGKLGLAAEKFWQCTKQAASEK